jgi:CheY-like chemotaxis protein
VDDESQLVTLARDVLAGAGYEFSGYTDPRAALAALGAAPGTFDLLVSDVSMPSMSGLEFARAARSICPSLPIVLVSGYVTPELTGEAARAGVRRVIEKPDLAATLRATVAALRE